MEVITRDTEEVRAYFEALEEGMRYLDTVTAHFRPAMNGEVYLTGEDVCRLLHITPRTLQDYRRNGWSRTYRCRARRFTASRICCVCWRRTTWTCAQSANGGKVQHKRTGVCIGKCSKGRDTASEVPAFAAFCTGERRQAVSRRERRTRFPSCFLSFFSSTLRCMAARLPEIARKSELTILLVTSA